MPAEKTLAIVIRTVPFGETSSVVTVFCREFGKLRALAKGAWRPKSGFDGGLDLLSTSQVLVLRRPSGGLDLLTEASLESRFRVGRSLAAVLGGLHIAELLDALTADADPQPELFDVAHATLRRLSDWRDEDRLLPAIVLRAELAMLRIVGHAPEAGRCAECGGPLGTVGRTAFGMLEGGTLCDRCRAGRRAVAWLSADALAAIRAGVSPGTGTIPLPARAITEARSVITTYIAHLLGRPTRVAARLRPAARRRTS
ncbi:MAG: DNA repair protein RecO [Planctomycetota bacterium]